MFDVCLIYDIVEAAIECVVDEPEASAACEFWARVRSERVEAGIVEQLSQDPDEGLND